MIGQLTQAICTDRLYPEADPKTNHQEAEEKEHQWRHYQDETLIFPLLRIWDGFSGSQPNEQGVMLARAPYRHLDTFEARKSTLTTHINHKKWHPTPYISFTSDPDQIKALCSMRFATRGSQTLTVIDPSVRLRAGLPIIDVGAEMKHYNIENPYKYSGGIFVRHYACLWQVNSNEIVGEWPQAESLVRNADWFTHTIMSAFRKHNSEMRLADSLAKLDISMSSLITPLKALNDEDAQNPKNGIVSGDYEDEGAEVEVGVIQTNRKKAGGSVMNDEGDEGDEVDDINSSDNTMKRLNGGS